MYCAVTNAIYSVTLRLKSLGYSDVFEKIKYPSSAKCVLNSKQYAIKNARYFECARKEILEKELIISFEK